MHAAPKLWESMLPVICFAAVRQKEAFKNKLLPTLAEAHPSNIQGLVKIDSLTIHEETKSQLCREMEAENKS